MKYCMEGIGPAPRPEALAAHLRFEEREEISRGIAVGRSIRQIAQGLGSGAIDSKPGDQAQRRAVRPIVQTGLIGVPGSGRCAPSLARLALYSALHDARVAQKLALPMVAAADLRLAEAGVPNPPKTCGYLTKRSIAASSSRPAAC